MCIALESSLKWNHVMPIRKEYIEARLRPYKYIKTARDVVLRSLYRRMPLKLWLPVRRYWAVKLSECAEIERVIKIRGFKRNNGSNEVYYDSDTWDVGIALDSLIIFIQNEHNLFQGDILCTLHFQKFIFLLVLRWFRFALAQALPTVTSKCICTPCNI